MGIIPVPAASMAAAIVSLQRAPECPDPLAVFEGAYFKGERRGRAKKCEG